MISRFTSHAGASQLALAQSFAREGIMRFLSLRALFLLGFVVAMPVLALPPVARWMDELLYGPPPSDFGHPPTSTPTKENVQPLAASPVSPTSFADSGPAELTRQVGGVDTPSAPPPLSPQASFAPLVPPPQTTAAPADGGIDERAMALLQEVRQRLEGLGAEYIVVETTDGSGQFCFRCRMLVEPQSRFTRSFEAAAADPVVAARQVLRDVETWRTAAAQPAGQAR